MSRSDKDNKAYEHIPEAVLEDLMGIVIQMSFSEDPYITAFQEGQRQLAQKILAKAKRQIKI